MLPLHLQHKVREPFLEDQSRFFNGKHAQSKGADSNPAPNHQLKPEEMILLTPRPSQNLVQVGRWNLWNPAIADSTFVLNALRPISSGGS